MTETRNIVQAEFFHVGGKGVKTLEALDAEILGRVADGAPIKTTVRFFDEGGFITDFVLNLASIEEHESSLVAAVSRTRGWKKSFLGRRHHRLVRRTLDLKARRARLAALQLRTAIETSRKVAVELPDRSFRPVAPDERHDLLEAAERATDAWIFVFKPNDLLADCHEDVASSL